MNTGFYKWSYDPRTYELKIWEVSGPESYANPQHGSVIGVESYAFCSQGRLTVPPVETEVDPLATIYLSRPFTGDAAAIQFDAKVKLRALVGQKIKWIDAQ